jgi:hypothetical protein
MAEYITTALDTLAVLLIAAGAAAFVFPLVGWGALALAGVVVLAGSQIAAGALDGVFARRKGRK